MHLLSPAPERRLPLTDDPDFWLRDLRLGRYAELSRNLADDGYRAARIAALLPTKRALACVADCLGLPADGTMATLRQRLLDAGAPVAPYLLAADFSRRKHKLAVEEIGRAVLSPEAWAATLDPRGEPDRLLLHLRLLQAAPEALVQVRGLDTWYRHGADAFVLDQRVPMPEGRLGDYLTAAHVEAAVADVRRPAGVPPIRFEMAVTRPNGDVLLCLRRNLKRAHLWSDDGDQIAHGHDEELILLHFLDGGRRLRLANARSRLARHLADAVASAWFGRPCRYVQDLLSAHPAAVQRMVAALVEGSAPGLRLLQLEVRQAPLDGAPTLVMVANPRERHLGPAVRDFEERTGPLLSEVSKLARVLLAFGDREVLVEFPEDDREPLVRFSDGRLPRRDAAAFRALVAEHFGLGAHPSARNAG